MEDETAVEAQGALGDGTQQEARRNLPMTIIETAAALKLLDQVVPDAYGAVKGAAKKVIDKVSGDRTPDARQQGPGSRRPAGG
jgi:hypothetical protein